MRADTAEAYRWNSSRESGRKTRHAISPPEYSANLRTFLRRLARDFEEKFSARLQGFAHSHDLLLKENWQGVAIDELVKSQLGAFADLS